MNETTFQRDSCSNCKHKHLKSFATPCDKCNVADKETPFPKWEKEGKLNHE